MEYFSATTTAKRPSYLCMQKFGWNLWRIMLNEANESPRLTHCVIPFIERKSRLPEVKKRWEGGRAMGMVIKGSLWY
jgi:hypothetical protein